MQNAPGLDRVMCQRLGGRFRCRVGQTPACSCVCGCGSKSDVVIVLSPEASAAHPQLVNGGEFRTAKVTTGSTNNLTRMIILVASGTGMCSALHFPGVALSLS